AKTTKKIVLRLQCQGCKHVSQRAIKVTYLPYQGASILRLVVTRRGMEHLFFNCTITIRAFNFLVCFSCLWFV
ncbi:hypothetical protein Lal_00041374, partial [Lupinus albus]